MALRTFDIVPALPTSLRELNDIARNLWWSWSPDAIQLFHDIDPVLWSASRHNPIFLLARCAQEKLDKASADPAYLARLARVHAQLEEHLDRPGRFPAIFPKQAGEKATIAYFCAEYALTESVRNYSGGLGVLAGDHLKTASDLCIPLTAVGLFYRQGYFEQWFDEAGRQQESFPEIDPAMMPFEDVKDAAGHRLTVGVPLPGREIRVRAWKVKVGRVPLYLLDANLPENSQEDRQITLRLYGGNSETRIQQELVLGIGGRRMLAALGINPTVRHLNEGHAAFLSLEEISLRMREGMSFDEALATVRGGQVFTTHTPVAAGIDKFDSGLARHYLEPVAGQMGVPAERVLDLGTRDGNFSMAVLALNTCERANGVARLHGEISRSMWSELWPGLPADEVPIGHVTNGVHLRSWMSGEFYRHLSHYLPSDWQDKPDEPALWDAVAQIPDEDLWRMHERYRRSTVRWVRNRQGEVAEKNGELPDEVAQAKQVLDDRSLTLGFARRFATYKRGTLILSQPERLLKLLRHPERPLQIVFSGKAHPADGPGKDVIAAIKHFAKEHKVEDRLVVLENYDMQAGRMLVRGVDVWLNTPIRPLEASGTSGMKAALNGVPQCSILDGWWDEGYDPAAGWAIGKRTAHYADEAARDKAEAELLYDLIEQEILPDFYDRDGLGVPHRWVTRMKATLQKHGPEFNTHRMLLDYCRGYYMPAHDRHADLSFSGAEKGRALAAELARLHEAFPQVRFLSAQADGTGEAHRVGAPISVRAAVLQAGLEPAKLRVQACYGPVGADGKLSDILDTVDLACAGPADLAGAFAYAGTIQPRLAGRFGLALRVVPQGELLPQGAVPGLIVWEGGEIPFAKKEAKLAGSGH